MALLAALGFYHKPQKECAYWLAYLDDIAALEEMYLEEWDPSKRFLIRLEIKSRMIEQQDGERP